MSGIAPERSLIVGERRRPVTRPTALCSGGAAPRRCPDLGLGALMRRRAPSLSSAASPGWRDGTAWCVGVYPSDRALRRPCVRSVAPGVL